MGCAGTIAHHYPANVFLVGGENGTTIPFVYGHSGSIKGITITAPGMDLVRRNCSRGIGIVNDIVLWLPMLIKMHQLH